MPQTKSPALVLAVRDFGEADCLVAFLTPTAGRVTAVAKHARKSKRRFMNCLEPFSLVEFIYTEKPQRELARLERGELLEGFRGLRRSLLPLATAAILTETTGELVGAADRLPEIFQTLKQALGHLAAGQHPWSHFLSHLLRLVTLVGFGPQWQRCRRCGQADGGLVWFNPERGGFLCQGCLSQAPRGRLYPLHLGSRKLILAAQRLPLPQLSRLRFPELARQETLAILQPFLRQIIGRELRAWGFLEKILPYV
ncbi:MAG: DNA repair protein RecO [Desulfobacca sp.]|uniref:DNA repair protein RecO n=1 Tax=Desulfobacca sp. TaxID=2067990 RepID=UPI00404ABFB7